jgi:hypothetical protein
MFRTSLVHSQGNSCMGKYELRSAVKKLYHLRPAVSKELHQLRRKIGVYKSPTI